METKEEAKKPKRIRLETYIDDGLIKTGIPYLEQLPVRDNENLIELNLLGCDFNEDLMILATCPNLETLWLGEIFDQPITALAKCSKLKLLSIKRRSHVHVSGGLFNQTLEPLRECKSLEWLLLGASFNKSLEPLHDHQNLEYFSLNRFHGCFNKSIEPLGTCKALKRVILSRYFDQPLDSLSSCPELQKIQVGIEYVRSGRGRPESLSESCRLVDRHHGDIS